MKYLEDAVVENQTSMRAWIEAELIRLGYTRSHSFADYFRACGEVVSAAVKQYSSNKYRSGEAYRTTAAEYALNFIDPWN